MCTQYDSLQHATGYYQLYVLSLYNHYILSLNLEEVGKQSTLGIGENSNMAG